MAAMEGAKLSKLVRSSTGEARVICETLSKSVEDALNRHEDEEDQVEHNHSHTHIHRHNHSYGSSTHLFSYLHPKSAMALAAHTIKQMAMPRSPKQAEGISRVQPPVPYSGPLNSNLSQGLAYSGPKIGSIIGHSGPLKSHPHCSHFNIIPPDMAGKKGDEAGEPTSPEVTCIGRVRSKTGIHAKGVGKPLQWRSLRSSKRDGNLAEKLGKSKEERHSLPLPLPDIALGRMRITSVKSNINPSHPALPLPLPLPLPEKTIIDNPNDSAVHNEESRNSNQRSLWKRRSFARPSDLSIQKSSPIIADCKKPPFSSEW